MNTNLGTCSFCGKRVAKLAHPRTTVATEMLAMHTCRTGKPSRGSLLTFHSALLRQRITLTGLGWLVATEVPS